MSRMMNALRTTGGAGAVMVLVFGLAAPTQAANIITFDDASQKCGGAVMCSYDGTTGYLNNGMGKPFNLSTIRKWFQIDVAGKSMLSGQLAEPDKDAGSFLVVNDTGAPITSFTLRVASDFTAKTASVHTCTGAQKGNICDNFTAHGGNGTTFNTGLSGVDWDRCTQGQTVGQTCTGNSGGVAADFSPGSVTYSWAAQAGKSIPAGATFRISFSGWNNDVWVAPKAYIPNQNSNNVSVIDTATNNVIATIGVGRNPTGVSVSPDGSKAYIANTTDNTVSVIDTAADNVIATIGGVGEDPWGLAVSPDGSKAYVTNLLSNTVSVIDTTSNTVSTSIAVADYPQGVSVSPDGSRVYVASNQAGDVSVIDTTTNTLVATIGVGVGGAPAGVAFSPDGSKAYVASDSLAGFVSVIDTATSTVVATIDLGLYAEGVTVSPDGSKVYVANIDDRDFPGAVFVIDAASNTVSTRIFVGYGPIGVSITPDGSHVYVANLFSNNVSVIDTSTNAVTTTIPVGLNPFAIGNFIQP